jgi:hypothetical protein
MGGPTAPGQFRSGTTVHNVKSFYAFILDYQEIRIPESRLSGDHASGKKKKNVHLS